MLAVRAASAAGDGGWTPVTGSGPVTAASTPRTRPPAGAEGPMRLHVGSGPARLEGWINVDRQDLPEVDLVADVTAGLPVGDGEAEAVFAEHFLEHLPLDDAVAFLREAHRVLAPGGWLRLTTPNLDWVVATHYVHRDDPLGKALGLNLGFHGWSHRFLWNQALLGEALAACGFEALAWRRPGESGVPFLRELERHERYPDTEALPHVLVVEGRRGAPSPERLAALRRRLDEMLAVTRPLAHRVDEEHSRAVLRLAAAGPLGGLVREHVASVPLRGHLRLVPEEPAETELALAAIMPRLEMDGAALRRRLGLTRLPERVRHRLEESVVGAARRDLDETHQPAFRSTTVAARGASRLEARGEVTWRDRRCDAVVALELTREGDVVRAHGSLALALGALGFAPWRLAGGLLTCRDELRIELELRAVAHYPT